MHRHARAPSPSSHPSELLWTSFTWAKRRLFPVSRTNFASLEGDQGVASPSRIGLLASSQWPSALLGSITFPFRRFSHNLQRIYRINPTGLRKVPVGLHVLIILLDASAA